jgi:hypothetical protein
LGHIERQINPAKKGVIGLSKKESRIRAIIVYLKVELKIRKSKCNEINLLPKPIPNSKTLQECHPNRT